MQDNYIIKQSSDRLICFFSSNENSILYKVYENNKWSAVKELLSDTLDRFTVTIAKNGNLYIFCQNTSGDIVLCTCDRDLDNWSNKIILKNQSDQNHTILFHPIIKSNGLCILYNIPSDSGVLQLVSQNLDDTGSWEAPIPIDDILTSKGNIFEVQNVTNDHLLVFYQTNRSENNIGYREVTSNKWGEFKPIHLTSYQISDTSFITTNNTVHALYVVKSMFSHQLIYRKKTVDGFTSPLVIWDGQKIDNCLLSIVNNTMYATFKYRGQLFISYSKNDGESFSKPEVYKDKFCTNPKKAIYLSESPMSENEYFVREVYVDTYSAWDIQILPRMYERFYPTNFSPNKSEVAESKADPRNVSASVNNAGINNAGINNASINNASINNITSNTASNPDIYNLKFELKKLREQNQNKEEQIAYMTNIINNYKSQKEDIDLDKINIEKKYLREIQNLKNRISELETPNEELKLKLKESESLNESLNLKLTEAQKLNEELNEELNSRLESQTLNKEDNISISSKSSDEDNRIITIQSTSPAVLIPYKR